MLKITDKQREVIDIINKETSLQEEKERFQLVAKVTNDAVWDWRVLINQIWWGQGLQTLFGYDLETVDPSFDFWLNRVHPDDRTRVVSSFKAAIDTGKSAWSYEYRFRRADDTWAYVFDRAYVIRNQKGEAIRAIGAMMDISERKRTEEALRIIQERYELAVCVGEVGVWDWNIETNEIYIDPNLKAALGYTDLDIENHLDNWYNLVHPEDRARVFAAIKTHLEGLTPQYEIEHRRLHKNGSIRWFLSRGTAFSDAEGKPYRMAGSDTDITKRKQTEEALERLSRQNESILNSAGEGILGLDIQGKITFVNPAAARMTGYTVDELIGQSLHEMLHHSNPDGTNYDVAICPIQAVFQDGIAHHGTDEIFWRKDGSSFPVEYTSTPIKEKFSPSGVTTGGLPLQPPLSHSSITGAVVTFRDISDRLIVERMKDEFVSMVSHELRTPLTSIRGSLGLLLTGKLGELSPQGQRMLEIAVNNTDRLVRLINDILNLQRMESQQVQIEKQICNASDLMNQAAEVMQAMADKAGVTLSVSPLSVELCADSDRLIQVLTNLLSNAIKFSPPGTTVCLAAEIHATFSPPNLKQILFQVKDQGRGIPTDKLEAVFGRFQQVDASDSRAKGGTGLGLAICRAIVQQHQGKIWVESILGSGSTFYVSIPLTNARE
jgi:PAS domain S-box-containing protein